MSLFLGGQLRKDQEIPRKILLGNTPTEEYYKHFLHDGESEMVTLKLLKITGWGECLEIHQHICVSVSLSGYSISLTNRNTHSNRMTSNEDKSKQMAKTVITKLSKIVSKHWHNPITRTHNRSSHVTPRNESVRYESTKQTHIKRALTVLVQTGDIEHHTQEEKWIYQEKQAKLGVKEARLEVFRLY